MASCARTLLPPRGREIILPPLRERADDIQLLANEFLARFSQERKTLTGFEDAAGSGS